MKSGENRELSVWKGEFGAEYTRRNRRSLPEVEALYRERYGLSRTEMNERFLASVPRSATVLEVGCNIGTQLLLLREIGFERLFGVEPSEHAVRIARERSPDTQFVCGSASHVPFGDECFDLVLTSGVLIHIRPSQVESAMREILRCTRRFVWGFEYYSEKTEEIPYRGRRGLLWKGDFLKRYLEVDGKLEVRAAEYFPYRGEPDKQDVMFLLERT